MGYSTDHRIMLYRRFFGFFLLSIFLDRELAVQNNTHHESLANRIVNNLTGELDSMDPQLRTFDQKLFSICDSKDSSHLQAMISENVATSEAYLVPVFKPRSYPYLQNVFWIDTTENGPPDGVF